MLRKVPGFFLPRFLSCVQGREFQTDHRCELVDLSKRHRMAGLLGGRDGKPRWAASQRHQRTRPRTGGAISGTVNHGTVLGSTEGGNAQAAIRLAKTR